MYENRLRKRPPPSGLHPLVQQLDRDLEEEGSEFFLPHALFDVWRKRLTDLKDDDRQTVAGHIVALALRLQEMSPDRCEHAVVQLAQLTSVLVGDPGQVCALFAGLGMDQEKLRAALMIGP